MEHLNSWQSFDFLLQEAQSAQRLAVCPPLTTFLAPSTLPFSMEKQTT